MKKLSIDSVFFNIGFNSINKFYGNSSQNPLPFLKKTHVQHLHRLLIAYQHHSSSRKSHHFHNIKLAYSKNQFSSSSFFLTFLGAS